MLFKYANLFFAVIFHLQTHVLAAVKDVLILAINFHFSLQFVGFSLPLYALILKIAPTYLSFLYFLFKQIELNAFLAQFSLERINFL